MNIREKITAWEPGAVWSEAGDGMFTVPVEKFHALAARLRAEGFDFLRSLTGMDWGEEGFGVFIESRGEKSPYRMKFRSTGLPLVSCLETIARGTKIADLIAIGGTLDYVVPDIDR